MLRILMVHLAACGGSGNASEPTPAAWIEASDALQWLPIPATGSAPVAATVRAVNAFGAAVTGSVRDVRLDGQDVEITLEPSGYGTTTVEQVGSTVLEVGGSTADVHVFEAGWPGFGWHLAWTSGAPDPLAVGAAGTGTVVADDTRVWWAGPGLQPHPVLAVDEPIRGLRSGAFDGDDTRDALAWTDTTAYLLSGRRAGGMSFRGALAATGHTLVAAAMGDLSGDQRPDLVVVWSDGDRDVLDIWEATADGFTAAWARTLDVNTSDVAIGDATGEGAAQITVMHRAGDDWSRFLRAPNGTYVPIGPSRPTTDEPPDPDSTLLSIPDMNGDGGAELALFEPSEPGNPREAFVYDLSSDDGVPVVPVRGSDAARFAAADGNGDALSDLWILDEDGQLEGLYWLRADDAFRRVPIGPVVGPGPIHALDVNFDGSAELTLATPGLVRRWWGTGVRNDPNRFWEPRDVSGTQVREDVLPVFHTTQLDEDETTVEAVTFAHEGGNTHLKVVRYTPGKGRAPQLVRLPVFPGEVPPDDLALCGDQAWFALGGRVFRVGLSQPNDVSIDMSLGDGITRVDCGRGPDGADAVVLDGDDARLLTGTGQPVSSTIVEGAVDVALGDLGEGPEARACATEGCTIVHWRYGDTGSAFAISDASGTRLQTLTDEWQIDPFHGRLTVADVDRDGRADLLGLDEARNVVWVHRSTVNGVGHAEIVHSERFAIGVVQVADGDGDGWPDLWTVDEDGDLQHGSAAL
ncbi:MAG: VCBS repeat-containing protein [Myxococcales bacterium]|nr:VCBS repeat-containing protein [Myxococcales bacterium]